ncbi:glycosyltransferase family 39 protein [Bacillus sp. CGMCC 1.60114]|uniref:glycosyltransferase family 39 protein n=1 Tax=unclassified Bacillus (in: firmicutes) TaxID=185979 RepID=UPI003626DAD0
MLNIQWSRLSHLLGKFLIVLCLIIFSFAIWNSYWAIKEILQIRTLISGPIIIFIMILLVLLSYLANKFLSRFTFILLLTVCAFTIRFIWIIKVPTPIESDFAVMYESAIQAAKGDFSFTNSSYYTTWVYQLGFTMYEAFIIKLFGDSTFILKFLNILYCTGTTLFVYSITSKIFNEWSGRIAGILYAFYIPSIMMSSILTNQHLATFLFYLGFYLLITRGLSSKYMWIFIGIILSFGDLMRPLGMLILLAVAIYFFLDGLLGKDKQTMLSTTKKLTGVIIIFYTVHYLIIASFIAAGITKYPLSNRDPLWKFVLGFNHETKGTYSTEDANHVMNLEIGEERKAEEKKIIKKRLADKEKVLELFGDKFSYMWGDIDASGYWSLGQLNKEKLKDKSMEYEKYIYVATMLFGVVGLLSLLVQNEKNLQYTLFLLLIIGYVCVHFLIEVQTRYRYFIIPSFFIIQSYGIYVIHQLIPKIFASKK